MNTLGPAFRRGIVVFGGLLFFGFGIWGVSVERQVGLDRIGVSIPAWWYLVSSVPPLIAVTVALALPTHHACWRRNLVSSLLICLSVVATAHAPLIYAIYDFEHPRIQALPSAPSR